MDDKIDFGDLILHWDDFAWSGSVEPPFFRSPYGTELFINTKDEEQMAPSDLQLHAWQNLLQQKDVVHQAVLLSVFEYYKEMRPKYAKAGPEWIERMPDLDQPNQLQDRIELTGLTLAWPYDNQNVQIGLLFRCAWDQEHGMGVVLHGTDVVEIGGADRAII